MSTFKIHISYEQAQIIARLMDAGLRDANTVQDLCDEQSINSLLPTNKLQEGVSLIGHFRDLLKMPEGAGDTLQGFCL
jgi:hypothetical protein